MSDKNDTNLMTNIELKRKLNSIHTDKPEIKRSLLDAVEQFHCLDRIARSVGLIKEGFSFLNKISWGTILSKLEKSENNEQGEINLHDIFETVSQSSKQLKNELIPRLQKARNVWMFEVILIEFVILALTCVAIASISYMQGLWGLSNIFILLQGFLYGRPMFSFIIGILLLTTVVVMHFKIRNFVAKQIVKKLSKESSEFELAGAFLKNTRIHHSIFRPDIIGWGWLSRKCIKKNINEEELIQKVSL